MNTATKIDTAPAIDPTLMPAIAPPERVLLSDVVFCCWPVGVGEMVTTTTAVPGPMGREEVEEVTKAEVDGVVDVVESWVAELVDVEVGLESVEIICPTRRLHMLVLF